MSRLVTDHLPLLAGAPNGVKKLRELILELAVCGKLVPQNANDEPANLLLERIAALRETKIPHSKMTRENASTTQPSETTHAIPETWKFVQLGQVVEIIRGITFPASEKSKEPAPGRIACLRTANIQHEVEWNDLLYISEEFVSRRNQILMPNDIVISMANSRELVGKVALVGNDISAKSTFGGFLGVIRPFLIEPRFIMALLRTPKARTSLIESASQTTNIANISLGKLRPLIIALPPLAEQNRIVAKVDELMALCDRLETRQSDAQAAHARLVDELLGSLLQARDAEDFAECWGRVKGSFDVLFTTEPSIDALKQAVLQLAVTGRLVKTKQDASEGWVTQRIEEFCTVQGGIQKTPLRRPVSQHFPYLRVLNVQRNRINVAELERYELTLDELARWRLNTGDLLIVEGNGSENEIGRCAIWNGEVDDCVYQNHLMRVRPHEPHCVVYLALYLNSPEGMAHMRRLAITTSGLFNLSVGKIRSIPVAMPSLAEQQRIVAKVEEFIAMCDRVKAKIAQAQALNERLAGTLVERAVS
jgi:type I restriction enzyme, S subunit